ncbi:MAG: ZIP family metal transporter [Thermoplasmata archaeon]
MDSLSEMNPIMQALLATSFTWFVTALGASMVFTAKGMSRKVLDAMLGFAAGVMLAASYWSLLAPAIEMSAGRGLPVWVPPSVGLLVGGAFLMGIDKVIHQLRPRVAIQKVAGTKTSRRSTLLVLAITLHNIPEGVAVGVAFGAVAAGFPSATLAGAIALALGIGIQNFPEGIAVSMPLRREGMSRLKSFWYGQLSGIVEIIGGVVGAAVVVVSFVILPYALAFAAGAMILVTLKELIPESMSNDNADLAIIAVMLGFAAMMVLDVSFS